MANIIYGSGGGGGPPPPQTGDISVVFLYRDMITGEEKIETRYCNKGEDIIPPTVGDVQANLGSNPALTFQEWNKPLTNMQTDDCIGATYAVTDGKTYAYVRKTKVTTSVVVINWTITGSGTLTFKDKDGTTFHTASSTTGTYTWNNGLEIDEWFTMDFVGSGNYTFGKGDTSDIFIINQYQLFSIYIGDNVKFLGENAFLSNYSFAFILIPNGIIAINEKSLYACVSINSITCPNTLQIIGLSAMPQLYNCSFVSLPNSITSIGVSAIQNMSSLQLLKIPNQITTIESNSFSGLVMCKLIVIPNSVTSISNNAFSSSRTLTSVKIPSSVINMGTASFSGNRLILEYDFTEYLSSDVVPIITLSTFDYISAPSKMLFRDQATLDKFKVATNWNTYANYMYVATT